MESSNDNHLIIVENGLIRVAFDAHGRIISFLDVLNQRNIIPEGSMANVFRFYEDIPLFWDVCMIVPMRRFIF